MTVWKLGGLMAVAMLLALLSYPVHAQDAADRFIDEVESAPRKLLPASGTAAPDAATNDNCDYVKACAAAMMGISQSIAEVGHNNGELGCPPDISVVYVDDTASGTNDGASWENAYTDLQTALAQAADPSRSYEIRVASGVYRPTSGTDRSASFQLLNCTTLTGGFPGGGGPPDTRNWTENSTELSGDIGTVGEPRDNSYHVVTATGTDASAVLDGFLIRGGNADALPAPSSSPAESGTQEAQVPLSPGAMGGGLYIDRGSPLVKNTRFSHNSARWNGGGIANIHSNPILINVEIAGNRAGQVGGMFEGGGGVFNYSSSPILAGVSLHDNSAVGPGGAIYNSADSKPLFFAASFTDNRASRDGGGMFNDYSDPSLTNVAFTGNSADEGGGMFNNESSPSLCQVSFTNNAATGGEGGGGIFNDDNSDPVLVGVTFIRNTATSGGGVYNDDGSSPRLYNTVFLENSVTHYGGGMVNEDEDSRPVFTNLTLYGNSAGLDGGAILNWISSPTLNNSVLWGNTPNALSELYGSSSVVSYSDVQGGWPGAGNIDVDPRFVDAVGGNLRPSLSSPLIDAGFGDFLPDDVTTDLDCNPRIVGGAVDIGAYEFPTKIETSAYLPALWR